MVNRLAGIVAALVGARSEPGMLPLVDAAAGFAVDARERPAAARSVNAAFLLALAGVGEAERYLDVRAGSDPVAAFYRAGLRALRGELDGLAAHDIEVAGRLDELAAFLDGSAPTSRDLAERLWSVFFPEGTGILGRETERAEELRRKRTAQVTETNQTPLVDPARQVLFTVNALMALPPDGIPVDELEVAEEVGAGLAIAAEQPQEFWYDHPIQIGVEPEASELLYGLRGLDRSAAFEKARGSMHADARLRVVMSVSVTHEGIYQVVRRYIDDELRCRAALEHIEVYAFTEDVTRRLVEEVLAPAARRLLDRDEGGLLEVFGVSGRYGRHHSFLRAVAPFWRVAVDQNVAATFKFDLDQTWPQELLVAQTDGSFLEHFRNPLWGGKGVDSEGRALDFGAMAGFLVNESDIEQSLFTPDVPYPTGPLAPDEYVFHSRLTQALATAGETSTRYGPPGPDGRTTALERVLVHGGTAAVSVEALCRYRPFTPSFIGRAEDQAFLLSAYGEGDPRLAYVHNHDLVQRHDKKGFASGAIEAARIGTLVGDYTRILLFSKWVDAMDDGAARKAAFDPFTGCFMSRIPITVTLLRFALKAAALFESGQHTDAVEFMSMGSQRIGQVLQFVEGEPSELEQVVQAERQSWNLYYDTLDALATRAATGDATAGDLIEKARAIMLGCRVG